MSRTTLKNLFLYTSTVLIWGSTWIGIKFQLGKVDPLLSVAYRFLLASVLLLAFSRLTGRNLRFSRREHLFMALQGMLLFSVNYWLVYLAEEHLTSGLVAVVFSTLVFMNIFVGALFLGTPVRPQVVAGATVGLIGIGLVFWPELSGFDLSDSKLLGLVLGGGGTLFASLGNITSARNQNHGLPVIQTNAFGMGYGALLMFTVATVAGVDFTFEVTTGYIGSLIFLSLFGSVFAFGGFLTLIGRIGADRAAYVSMLFPLVALLISTFFEDYRWSGFALCGVALTLAGNFLVLSRRRRSVHAVAGAVPGD